MDLFNPQKKKANMGNFHHQLPSERVEKTDPEISWRYTVPGWEATDRQLATNEIQISSKEKKHFTMTVIKH